MIKTEYFSHHPDLEPHYGGLPFPELEEQGIARSGRILLILPCMNWQKYRFDFENGRFWRIVLHGIQPWRTWLDIYSIDCIKLKSTEQMLGLWSPYKEREILWEIITNGLDSYPAWARYKTNESLKMELESAVRRRLLGLENEYRKIISFLNVKAYHECISKLSNEFGIVALPIKVDWTAARAVPCRNLRELNEVLGDAIEETPPLIQPVLCNKHH